jgi:dipeptidyl-peptidase 4
VSRSIRRPTFLPVLALALCAGSILAQDSRAEGRLTLEGLYHPTLRKPVVGGLSTQLGWLSDGVLQETRLNRRTGGVELVRLEPKTWEAKPLLDEASTLSALVKAGVSETDAKAALGGGALVWNEQRTGFVVGVTDDLFHVNLADGQGRRLTNAPGAEEEATFSPDGARVAYVRNSDLFASQVSDGVETRLTTDGSATLFNGKLDWVYQEELYGRGNWRGFWWSPDSSKVAYLQLDESKVPTFTVLDHRPLHQQAHTANYPKVGDPNPTARLGVVAASGGATKWMFDPYEGQETLISNVGWTPDNRVLAQWQNRAQTWLDLLVFDAEGKSRVVLRETTKAWVERSGNMPKFLADGSFLWESDRSGFHHVYRHAADGSLLNAVTAGDWDVVEVHGTDEKNGLLYFSAKERSPITTDVYKVGLDGKGLTRITQEEGTHMVVRFSPDFTWFLDVFTDVATPVRQVLRDGSGKEIRVIDPNASPPWQKVVKGKVSFQQVPTRDGFAMETMLVLPVDFDETKKYPVMSFVYGGPNTPQVKNAFSRHVLFYHLLAQEGYVVWVCDNRSASGKGWGSAWGVHKDMGAQELQDQLDGLAWLKQKPWVDGARVGLHGWSYGGYLTLYAMTHCDAYKCGVAGAPVTDWRLYDSIYTERYMGLLAENKEGYDRSSVLRSAKDLKGSLLILHGTMDDNVHPQNTLQFLDALHAAGKHVELMLIPGSDHSPAAPDDRWAVQSALYGFIKRNL